MSLKTGNAFGVLVLPTLPPNTGRTVQHASYIHEILDHAGVCHKTLPSTALSDELPELGLLLTVGDGQLAEPDRKALSDWVGSGGCWLSVGSVCGMEDVLGISPEAPAFASWGGGARSLGEGYLHASVPHPVMNPVTIPLHFFGGIAIRTEEADILAVVSNAHQHLSNIPAVTVHNWGQGSALFIAPDITGTIVRIQQGIAVMEDGISAPDGSSPIADGVLKSDDGAVLDWVFDRQSVPGMEGYTAFLQPIADHWRALLLRAVFHLAEKAGMSLPVLWLYPNNLPALAHISHDTDGNSPTEGWRMLEILKQLEINTTWCILAPGYEPDLISAIREAGHELAMHYDAMTDGTTWSFAEFEEQNNRLTALFGGASPRTNKNHYLRWEGDVEFYKWCEKRGIELDQSKGATKTGGAGYLFGTCHLFFPIDREGNRLNVLELSTVTQDLIVFAPEALFEPLMQATLEHHGVLHLLFHPAHIMKEGVEEAMTRAACRIKREGLPIWTANQLNNWERARRAAVWKLTYKQGDAASAHLETPVSLSAATVLWLSRKPGTAAVNGMSASSEATERWGFQFQSVNFDAAAGSKTILSFEPFEGDA